MLWRREQGTSMTTQVVAYQGGWDVIYEGARYAESHHATWAEAVAAGIIQARRDGATLVTFDRKGRECTRKPYLRGHSSTLLV
jgi:hypothetical protein